ncbi:MAG: hypothetical protein KatS3mg033_2031 [Thermonema sp.]|uniref:hypothetical protein n=1 Tax=Thermonema sp. TaxID=2231181 RepID=UPI0021DD454F|nr:hypothetical protein [Thermonema sp.]GIV28934.1 MAG: hypothetical protein KatS3mg027_2748 [Bacteroidia bacterium]GIV40231.1 MAG: hypothetical protein KatS3mg033_2031 [Thermonema sp.]
MKANQELSELKSFLLCKISQPLPSVVRIVEKSVPIVFFGNIEKAEIATLSLNPSNKEFVKKGIKRLVDREVLGVKDNEKLNSQQAEMVYQSLLCYFKKNPYKGWFNHLNKLFQNKGYEYYNDKIVHLDISPWATSDKWNKLSKDQRESIIDSSDSPIIKKVIELSNIRYLFINGKTTFDVFRELCKITPENIQEKNFEYLTKSGSKRNLTIYESTFLGRKVVAWNLYVQRSCPDILTQQIQHYL